MSSPTSHVWESFLTPTDKAHIDLQPARHMGLGSKPALLVVDMYRWVFGDRKQPLLEAIERWPGSCGPAAWDALPAVVEVLTCARHNDVPVIYTTGRTDNLYGGSPKTRRSGLEHPVKASIRYAIMPQVGPVDGEAVLEKAGPSGFSGTPLGSYLNFMGVDTVVVVGESTSGCVRATVVDAFAHRFRVAVVEEAVFDRHEASHAMSLFDMDQKYADVLPKSTILNYLGDVQRDSAAHA